MPYKKCPVKFLYKINWSFSISIPQCLLELFLIKVKQFTKRLGKIIALFRAAELHYVGKRLKLN